MSTEEQIHEISVTCPNCQMKKIKTEDGFRFDFTGNAIWMQAFWKKNLSFPICLECYEGKKLKF